MLSALQSRFHAVIFRFPALLACLSIVDRDKGDEAFDLAVPVMVSGGVRTVLRASDFFMISLALGGSAVAGLELGFQYYSIGFGLALGLSSGTISLVSHAVGAGGPENANFAVKQSLWVALTLVTGFSLKRWLAC